MAGAQIQGGRLVSDKGMAKSATVNVSTAEPGTTTIFTATLKTKVMSVFASNTLGTIIPVNLYVYRDSSEDTVFIGKTRVLKVKYLVFPLVEADNRTGETAVTPTANRILTEIVLQPGDALLASCPIAGAVNVTAEVKEGIK
jgi:hypothetical protein